jgi:hypothetical protein
MPVRAPASIAMLTDGHAAFHRQIADRTARELDCIPVPPALPILPITPSAMSLAVTPTPELAFDRNCIDFDFLHHHALCGEHMLDFAGADAETQARRTRHACWYANPRTPPSCRAALRHFPADHMHDALALVEKRKINLGAEFLDVFIERLDLQTRNLILDPAMPLSQLRVGVL